MMGEHPPLWWIAGMCVVSLWLCWVLRPRSSKGT